MSRTPRSSRSARRPSVSSDPEAREAPFDPHALARMQDQVAAFDPEAPEPTGRLGPSLTLQDIRSLPPRQRAAVLLVFWGDLSLKDTASLLSTTEIEIGRAHV